MEENINQGANPELYKYLVETYGSEGTKIEVLDNGGYYLIGVHSDNGCHVNNIAYVPPNIDDYSGVSMISYYPGGGGIQKNSVEWVNKILSDNPPNTIITLASSGHQSTDIMEIGCSIAEAAGSKVTSALIGTFSASANKCTINGDEFVGAHPDIDTTLIIIDGSINRDYVGQNLIDNQTPIIAVSCTEGLYWHNEVKCSVSALKGLGYNIVSLQSEHFLKGQSHETVNADTIKSGFFEYILGLTDELDSKTIDLCNFKLFSYENDDYVLIGDGKDYSMLRQESLSTGFTLEKLTYNPFEEGTVASDMLILTQSLNSIRGYLTSGTIQTPSCSSTSNIPGSFVNSETSLVAISNDLKSTIYEETKILASIVQVFYDLDRERAKVAYAISNGEPAIFNETSYFETYNNLINIDLTSDIKFDSFMLNPNDYVEGNSGKLYLSDINSMLGGNLLIGPLYENLESERLNARSVKTEIENLYSMISSGRVFQGGIWTTVSTKLNEYSELMDLRIEMADTLEAAMVNALTLLKDYMGEYEELDDSKLPSLRENVTKIKNDIIEAQQIVDATHVLSHPETLEDGSIKLIPVREYVYSVNARKQAMENIQTAKVTLGEIERIIVKLEGLPIVLAQASQIVNNALNQIYNKYAPKVSCIVTGQPSSYIPPVNTSYSNSTLPSYKPWTYQIESAEEKVDMGKFYLNTDLVNRYGGSYNDYLNGVERKNNPMYNADIEDNGIEPGESIDDKIFDEDISSLLENIPPVIEIQ